MEVVLNSVDKVKTFAKTCSRYEGHVFLKSGRYIIDAKSIMGILSLDLTQPIKVIFEDESQKSDFLKNIKEYLV